jgi:hypothetical protein
MMKDLTTPYVNKLLDQNSAESVRNIAADLKDRLAALDSATDTDDMKIILVEEIRDFMAILQYELEAGRGHEDYINDGEFWV